MDNKPILLFFLLFISVSITSFAQYGFEKKYGASGYEEGHCVINTNDGNFAVFGFTNSTVNGDADGYILKINQKGDSLWMKMYGGSGEDVIKYGIQTADSGYLLCGYTDLDSTNRNILLIKTDSTGTMEWMKNYGGADEDYAYSLQSTIDSAYIVTGKTKSFGSGNYDMFSFKIDMMDDSIWFKTYGTSLNDIARHIEITNDSAYVIVGSSQDILNNNYDVQLLKLDFFGDTLWTKRFHQRVDCFGYSTEQTSDNGYILCGFHEDTTTNPVRDIFVIKTDSLGNEQWRDTVRSWSFDYEGTMLHSIKQTNDGFYIAVGTDHLEVICKRSNGEPLHNEKDNLFITKLNNAGSVVWENSLYHSNYLRESGMGAAIVDDSTYIFCGYAQDYWPTGTGSIFVVKTNLFGNPWNAISEYEKGNYALSVFPNPANSYLNITLNNEYITYIDVQLIDIMGRVIHQEKFNNVLPLQTINLNIEKLNLSGGIYLLTVEDDTSKKGIARVSVIH